MKSDKIVPLNERIENIECDVGESSDEVKIVLKPRRQIVEWRFVLKAVEGLKKDINNYYIKYHVMPEVDLLQMITKRFGK